MQCKECDEDLPKDGQYVVCKTGCGGKYHFDCTTISQSTYTTRSKKDKATWRCHRCRYHNNNERDKDGGDSSCENRNADGNNDLLKEILYKMNEMQKEMQKENEQMRSKLDMLIQQNKEKDAIIAKLHTRINELEQYSRRDSIEIYGAKEYKDENVEEVVYKIFEKLSVKIEKNDIQVTHRLTGSVNKNKNIRPIIVKLQRKKAEEILMIKKLLVNDDIYKNGDKDKVYINESMTSYYKQLLWAAKNKAKEAGYRYVWFRRGKLLVRRQQGDKAKRIYTEEDINKFIV